MAMVGMSVCSAGPQEWERLWRGTSASLGHLLAGVGKSCFGGAGQVGWVGLILSGDAWVVHTVLARLTEGDRKVPASASPAR